ncbi:uncharacterized protein LOC113280661 [Papaver somniferum]|uniref:uncharacterized protein LOC113280661 n=1 Tax=Papaver somniferum TaxID=3469 RepID=UPI000E6F4ED1|nr:uncharacterized protein LOC113280661 [Papaver somniferum]
MVAIKDDTKRQVSCAFIRLLQDKDLAIKLAACSFLRCMKCGSLTQRSTSSQRNHIIGPEYPHWGHHIKVGEIIIGLIEGEKSGAEKSMHTSRCASSNQETQTTHTKGDEVVLHKKNPWTGCSRRKQCRMKYSGATGCQRRSLLN